MPSCQLTKLLNAAQLYCSCSWCGIVWHRVCHRLDGWMELLSNTTRPTLSLAAAVCHANIHPILLSHTHTNSSFLTVCCPLAGLIDRLIMMAPGACSLRSKSCIHYSAHISPTALPSSVVLPLSLSTAGQWKCSCSRGSFAVQLEYRQHVNSATAIDI